MIMEPVVVENNNSSIVFQRLINQHQVRFDLKILTSSIAKENELGDYRAQNISYISPSLQLNLETFTV